MFVVVTGIPGSGKTTVIDGAVKKISGVEYKVLTYGTVMFEIAKKKKLVLDRDEMRKMSPKNQKMVQEAAADYIKSESKKGNVILDTHCTIKTLKGFLPGLPLNILQKLNPDAFVIVDSSAEDIYERRSKDGSRNRDADSVEEIRVHQDMNLNVAAAYSVLTGGVVKVVHNRQGMLDKAVEDFISVLK